MTMSRTLARSALALLVATTLAACGDDDDGGGGDLATLGDGETAADDDASGDSGDDDLSDAEREDALLEFAECMREHGVDMPDPDFSGGGAAIALDSRMGSPEELEAAQQACDHLMEDVRGSGPQMNAEEEAEMRDNMLAFAQCMREHGVDMPDPEFEGGGRVRSRVGQGGIDPESDEFADAQEACRGELGFEEGEGPMAGPPRSDSRASGADDEDDE